MGDEIYVGNADPDALAVTLLRAAAGEGHRLTPAGAVRPEPFLLDVPEFFDISRAFLQSAGKARGLKSKAFSIEVDTDSREENASNSGAG